MMKLIGKLLGGVATAAALAALIPYTSDYDAETDTQKTHALLWTLTSKPNLEGKRSYHFAFGKEDEPVIEFRAGESEAEAAEGTGEIGTTLRARWRAHLGERTAATRSSTAAREARRRRLELGESGGAS